MTLDHAILLEDALEMEKSGLTKEQFITCVKERVRPTNADAWDEMLGIIERFGSRRKAMNWVEREIERAL